MDVRIGIVESSRELEVDLGEEADRKKVLAEIESVLGGNSSVLKLTDRRGRLTVVPASRVAYVEVGAPSGDRRVGFGAP